MLGLLQIKRIEPFGEPAVDRSEKLASLIPLALIAPEPRHAHCRTEFPILCLLFASNIEGAIERRFCLGGVRFGIEQRDFARHAMHMSLILSVLGLFDDLRRLVETL